MTGALKESLPVDASAGGGVVDEVVVLSVAILSVIAIAAVLWMAWLIVAGARRKVPRATGTTWQVPTMTALLFVVGFDGYLLVRSFAAPGGGESADALRVEVNGHQWAWEFRYAGKDGLFATADDVVTTNDLRVPVNRPVLLEIASSDVVHSFHLPNFRVKRDAIPGHLSRVGFTATRRGRFEIACAQFCGVQHYLMSAVLHVGTEAEVARFLEQGSEDSLRLAKERARAESEGEIRKDVLFPTISPPAVQRDWGWPWR